MCFGSFCLFLFLQISVLDCNPKWVKPIGLFSQIRPWKDKNTKWLVLSAAKNKESGLSQNWVIRDFSPSCLPQWATEGRRPGPLLALTALTLHSDLASSPRALAWDTVQLSFAPSQPSISEAGPSCLSFRKNRGTVSPSYLRKTYK